jgi:hypothetical protein
MSFAWQIPKSNGQQRPLAAAAVGPSSTVRLTKTLSIHGNPFQGGVAAARRPVDAGGANGESGTNRLPADSDGPRCDSRC